MKYATLKYFWAAVTAFIIWGVFAIPLRLLSTYSSVQILEYRLFCSVLFISVIILGFRRKRLKEDILTFRNFTRPEKRRFQWLTLLAAVLLWGNWFSYIYVVNQVSITSAAFAYLVCPLLTAIGGFVLLKEKLTLQKIAGIFIALISLLILATGSLRDVAWSVLVAGLYACYLVILRTMTSMDKLNMLAIHLIIAVIIMLPYYIGKGEAVPVAVDFWIIIVIVALFFTIIPLFLNLYALIKIPSSSVGIIMYINPIVAFIVAFLYFHEPLTILQLSAYALLAVSIVIFNLDTVKDMLLRRSAG